MRKRQLEIPKVAAIKEEPPKTEVTEEPKKKFKLHVLDLYVIFSIFVLIVYTIVSQVIASIYMVQLDTLTTCFFAAFGGEIFSACLIKIFKLHKEVKKNDPEEGVG